jgi:hypothetical protein
MSVFPRLIVLAVVDVRKTPHRIQLVLYRPINLATLLEVCNKWTSGIATDIVSLFGRTSKLSGVSAKEPGLDRPASMDVNDLLIKKGAYVSRPGDKDNLAYSYPAKVSSWCRATVHIEEDSDIMGIKETLGILFDYPGRAGEPSDRSCRNPRSSIDFECSSSVLALLPEAVSLALAV